MTIGRFLEGVGEAVLHRYQTAFVQGHDNRFGAIGTVFVQLKSLRVAVFHVPMMIK